MEKFIESGNVGKVGDNNDIVKRWGSLGLLDLIQGDELKKILAYTYEEAAKIILSKEPGFYENDVETMIFPMICRIIIKGKEIVIFDEKIIKKFASDLLEDVNKVITEQIGILKDIHADVNIDIEAEFCASYCNNFDLTKYFN